MMPCANAGLGAGHPSQSAAGQCIFAIGCGPHGQPVSRQNTYKSSGPQPRNNAWRQHASAAPVPPELGLPLQRYITAAAWPRLAADVLGPASLEVSGEKSGRVVPRELRYAGVPAHVGAQRLLLGTEGVEQL